MPKAKAEIGHNSDPLGGFSADIIKSIVNRVEKLSEEKSGLASDIRDIFSEAKAAGIDVKVLRKVIALRKLDESSRIEQDTIMDLYMHALGMV